MDREYQWGPVDFKIKTDEDVYELLQRYNDEIIKGALRGIYDCNRAIGMDVLGALKSTLLSHVGEHLEEP